MWHLGVLSLLVFALLCCSIETAVFQGCDHIFYLNPGVSYLESPYYPQPYPSNSSCRYKFKAPLNYAITVQCSINLPRGNEGCSTESVYFARDGDTRLRGSEQLCGSGSITRKSLFNIFTIAYISRGSAGTFNCSLTVRPQPCKCGWSVHTKIVNGAEAKANEYPSLVALRDRTTNVPLYCAGSIISPIYILTAAHCARFQPNPRYIDILVGRQNLTSTTDTLYTDTYRVAKIIVHPDYSPHPTYNDIALMRTTQDIEYKRGVGPICLPPITNINNNFAYSEVDVAGWGFTTFAGSSSTTLQKITLSILNPQACVEAYKDSDEILESHICTYDISGQGKDSCQHDSGGPVILYHLGLQYLVGIISFGRFCGAGGYAVGVNERVTYHLWWILQNTNYSTCYVQM